MVCRYSKRECDYSGVKDRRSFTPLHCASQSGNVEVVVALLEGGADANARGFAGATPLHISVSYLVNIDYNHARVSTYRSSRRCHDVMKSKIQNQNKFTRF